MSTHPAFGVTPLDVARIEAWAQSSYPSTSDGTVVVVHSRGDHVHIEEQRPLTAGGISARTILRLRHLPRTGAWVVHRAAAGGRWIVEDHLSGPLAETLDRIDLRDVPSWRE